MSAALSYRAHAPLIDSLLQEIGLSGSSLSGLVPGAAQAASHGANGANGAHGANGVDGVAALPSAASRGERRDA